MTGLPLNVMSQATLDDPSTPIAVTSNAVVQEQGLVNAFAAIGRDPREVQLRAVRDERLLRLGHRQVAGRTTTNEEEEVVRSHLTKTDTTHRSR